MKNARRDENRKLIEFSPFCTTWKKIATHFRPPEVELHLWINILYCEKMTTTMIFTRSFHFSSAFKTAEISLRCEDVSSSLATGMSWTFSTFFSPHRDRSCAASFESNWSFTFNYFRSLVVWVFWSDFSPRAAAAAAVTQLSCAMTTKTLFFFCLRN